MLLKKVVLAALATATGLPERLLAALSVVTTARFERGSDMAVVTLQETFLTRISFLHYFGL
jgi:hypothetical protein